MKQHFRIRRFQESDAPPVFRLCSGIPELSPWPLSDFENVQDAGFEGWIAETQTRIVGFVITRCASDELQILQLGTEPEFRPQGVASALLAAAFEAAASQGVRRAFLEVRASNAPAISLYQVAGFRLTGRRPNYYSAPVEDGLRMACDLERKQHFPIGG
jgi:ribosomal-protein-alanine N-acetyltransferase